MGIGKKIFLLTIGTMMAAFGIDLAIHAGFGGATLAVLWQGISRTFGMTLGEASFVVALVMLLFCLLYDRRQIYLGTILYQIIYSVCTDLFQPLLRYTDSEFIDFFIMIAGIILFAVGTALYSYVDWGKGAYEAVTFALAQKQGWQVKYVRIALDVLVVVIGAILGGQFGLCTVCTILLSGYMIQRTLKFLHSFENKRIGMAEK